MYLRLVLNFLLLSAKIIAMSTIGSMYIAKDWAQCFIHGRQAFYCLSSTTTLKSCVMYFMLMASSLSCWPTTATAVVWFHEL